MTPTEKKYSKLIGNMYWEDVGHTTYDRVNDKWVTEQGKQLIFISGIQKGNNWNQYSNDFYYKVDILQRPFPTGDDRTTCLVRCKLLQECLQVKSTYYPVDIHEQASV